MTLAIFVLTACLLLSVGCAMFQPQILSFDNVMHYKLEVDPILKIPDNISGFSFGGSSRACGYEVKTNNNVLVILVKISQIKGDTGYFSIPLHVGDNINELRFGTEQHLIWQRGELSH